MLSVAHWFLAFSPVVVLLAGILLFKWDTPRVGAVSWFISIFVAYVCFGAGHRLLALANSKGLSLSLYVLLIIWSAIFLYNIVEGAGAVDIISTKMQGASDDGLIQCLLLSWCFTSLLQGIAGFGVPVAVVAPIMVAMGFDPIVSVATCLVGHSWSISFGSMGSSYNAIQLVTKIPGEIIGPCMALIFSITILSTGLSVAHIYGGIKDLKRSVPLVLLIGAIMSGTMWLMNYIGVAHIASLAAGIIGCIALSLVAFFRGNNKNTHSVPAPVPSSMSFTVAASPYYAVILITMISQVPAIRTALPPYSFSLDYPEISTTLGYLVEAVSGYSKIRFFSHPALILFVSAIFGIILYSLINARGRLSGWQLLAHAASDTVKKCIPTSSGVATMVMMALVMSDSGMTNYIARGVAAVFGGIYLFASPFVGALGTFITGSNTNSNIMFGIMQCDTAVVLGQSAILMAASQSVGGSLGVSIAPSTIMMGATNVSIIGRENEVMRRTIKYGLINITLTGLFVWFLGGYYN